MKREVTPAEVAGASLWYVKAGGATEVVKVRADRSVKQVVADVALKLKQRPRVLVLPYPPSVNRLYRVGRNGRPYKTDLHRDYMAAAHRATLAVAPWPRDVELDVVLRLFRPQRRGDIDNPLKALFDALNGRVWEDDSQVVDLHVRRLDDKARPRVEVEVSCSRPEVRTSARLPYTGGAHAH